MFFKAPLVNPLFGGVELGGIAFARERAGNAVEVAAAAAAGAAGDLDPGIDANFLKAESLSLTCLANWRALLIRWVLIKGIWLIHWEGF